MLLVGVQNRGYGDSVATVGLFGGEVSLTIGNSLYEGFVTGAGRGG